MRKGISQSVAIVLILLVVGGFFLWKSDFFQASVMSVSNVNYVSNDPEIAGPAWLITVVQDEKGDNIILNLNKELLVDSADKVKANRDAKLSFSIEKMEARYTISYQNTNIKKLNYVKTLNLFNQDNCEKGEYGAYYAWGKSGFDYYCFITTNTAGYGLLLTPSTIFETTVVLESAGQTYTAKISSLTSTVASIIDPATGRTIGRINWVGSLSTGEESPKASDQKISAAYTYASSGWKTINDLDYTTYATFDFIACTGGSGVTIGTRDFDYCVNEWNRKESNALAGKSLTNQAGGSATVTGSTLSNGQAVLPLSKAVMFPVLTIKLDAKLVDTVAIEELVGNPGIVSLTTSEFQTGSTGYITTEVYNYGTATGSFEAWAVCASPFSQAGTNQFLTVGVSQTGFTNIPITANVVEKTSRSCTVTVRDRNNPIYQDSKSVAVTASPIILCSASSTRCNGNLIEQCNLAGSGWAVKETCQYGCEIKNNQAICVGTPPPPPDSKKIPMLFPIIAGVLAFLTTGANALRKKDWVGIATSGVIGLIVGLVVFWIMQNLIKILLASAIGLALGGVAIYFLGGVILFIVFILMQIIRTVKG